MFMSEAKDISEELKAIREDLEYIKENMVDRDMVLTADEQKRLQESLEDYRKGRAIKLKHNV